MIITIKKDLNGIQPRYNSLNAMQKSVLIEQILNDYLDQDKAVTLVSMLIRSYLK